METSPNRSDRRGEPRAVAFEVSTLLVERPSGVRVYGESLLRALRELRPEREYRQLLLWTRWGRRALAPDPDLPVRPYATGALLHRSLGLVHALDTRIPTAFRGPLVATLFDVISALPLASRLGLSSRRFVSRKRRDYRRIARRAHVVVALSRETRDRFLEIESTGAHIVVIPPGVGEEFFRTGAAPADPDAPRRLGWEGRFLLVVGGLHPRKNLKAAYDAFQKARMFAPDLRLAVVGEPGRGWSGTAIAGKIAGDDRVRLLGYVPPKDLAVLYRRAAALLYLSHYEGFGLPVLEAMACGTPVIASRRGGIPEAAGDAALLVDPDRPDEVDSALGKVLSDGALAGSLRMLGLERARRFTWEEAARALDEVHDQAREIYRSRAGR